MDDAYVENWSKTLRGETFIDVGAHLGRYTIPLARRFWKGIAFEPFDEARRGLEAALKSEGIHNVDVRSEAVSSKIGEAELFDFDGEGKSLFAPHPVGGTEIPSKSWIVQTITLDSLDWPDPVDFIKIDTEGAEIDILEGAQEILLEHRPRMQVEIHREGDFDKVAERLRPICRTLEIVRSTHPNIGWVLGYR